MKFLKDLFFDCLSWIIVWVLLFGFMFWVMGV